MHSNVVVQAGLFPVQEMKKLLKLAAPIIAAQLMQCLNSFIDTIMAGRHSPETLSQVAMGGSIWVPLLILSSGVFSGVSALSSNAFGAGKVNVNRELLNASLILAICLALIFMTILNMTEYILPLFNIPDNLVFGITEYVSMVSLGFPALLIFWAFRGWVEGLHKTRMAMIASLIAVLLNVPLNAMFIHGFWFIPSMGAKGCGIATSLSSSTMPFVMLWLMRRDATVQGHQLKLRRFLIDWQFKTIKSILKIGGPVGFSGFVEGSFFCVIAIFLAPLGITSIAAHQITLNISSLMFMVPLGLNFAITVAVGKALGEGLSAFELRKIVHSGLLLALVFALCSCTAILLLKGIIPTLYTTDTAVRLLASELLLLAAIFQIPDSLQVSAYGALKGLQDAFIPMFIGIAAYWLLGATLGYSFTYFESFGALGARGAWIGLNIGLAAATVAFAFRLAFVFRRVTNSSLFVLRKV